MNKAFWRRNADLALAGLVAVATLVAAGALLLSGRGFEAALAVIVTICLRSLAETLAHGADLGRLTFLLPVALGVLLGAGEAAYSLYGSHRLVRALAIAQRPLPPSLARLVARLGLDGQVILVASERPVAFTQALFRPRVWLSTGLLTLLEEAELEAVLWHEAHHLRARDPLKVLLARCLQRGLFFVPVANELCQAYCVAKEVAADAQAVHAMGDARPLVRALRKLLAKPPAPAFSPGIADNPSVVEARLRALLKPDEPRGWFRPQHVGLSVGWLLFLLAAALAPTADHVPALSECAPNDL